MIELQHVTTTIASHAVLMQARVPAVDKDTTSNRVECVQVSLNYRRGGSRRIQAGGLGLRTPLPFWGTPKLHKEGENVACMCAKTPRCSTQQLPGPPFFPKSNNIFGII